MKRWPVVSGAVCVLSVLAAVLLWRLHPVLALGPLMCPGFPAAVMASARLRFGDPYAVSPRAVARDLRRAGPPPPE